MMMLMTMMMMMTSLMMMSLNKSHNILLCNIYLITNIFNFIAYALQGNIHALIIMVRPYSSRSRSIFLLYACIQTSYIFTYAHEQ